MQVKKEKDIGEVLKNIVREEAWEGLPSKEIENLRLLHPNLSPDQLFQHLIELKIKKTLIIAICCCLPTFFFPKFINFFIIIPLVALVDFYLTLKLQIDLSEELSVLYQYKVTENTQTGFLLSILGLKGLTDDEPNEREAGERIVFRIIEEVIKRLLLLMYPIIGTLLCMGGNYLQLIILSKRVQEVVRNKGINSIENWDESIKTHILLPYSVPVLPYNALKGVVSIVLRMDRTAPYVGNEARKFVKKYL